MTAEPIYDQRTVRAALLYAHALHQPTASAPEGRWTAYKIRGSLHRVLRHQQHGVHWAYRISQGTSMAPDGGTAICTCGLEFGIATATDATSINRELRSARGHLDHRSTPAEDAVAFIVVNFGRAWASYASLCQRCSWRAEAESLHDAVAERDAHAAAHPAGDRGTEGGH